LNLSDLWDWIKSIKTIREIDPDNIPDPSENTIREMTTKEEEERKSVNVLKIKF
jgi:hypothetical protein